MRNSLSIHLVRLVGHGKQFDATPTKVTIKCNPDKPTPCNLIDNIGEYMESFKKGSSTIRKVFTAANPDKVIVDIDKFNGKISGDRVSINQVLTCFKNLQCKYLSNDYLDYKSRALHGKTQFNSNLAHYKQNIQKWCNHCLEMGIRTSENFEHAVYRCPQVQYTMYRVKDTLNLDCEIKPSTCIFSCPRPPEATKKTLTKCTIIDIVWIIVMKIALKSRIDSSRMCEKLVFSELKNNLEIITRNFPTHAISTTINNLKLIEKLKTELSQS